MKRLSTIVIALICATNLFAQSGVGNIELRLVDSKDSRAIISATVSLSPSDGSTATHKSSNRDGECTFASMAYGKYDLMITYVGYDTIRRNIALNRTLLNLGNIAMEPKSHDIEAVSVMGNAIRTSQSGDTIIYNADAYKVAQDAAAETLLAKMPGITVDDGEVEAQGESVKKVYVDGKEFFGEDVTIAVKNIPAEIIAKVEVFNKLSDEAEFTGFDDGNGYKALNIVTRAGMNRGHFGKFTGGYAYENLYQASANYNYFTSNHRLSLVGMSNNMNIKGFGSTSVGSDSSINRGGGMGGGGSRGSRGGGGSGSGSRSMVSGSGSFTGASSGISTSSGVGVNYGGTFVDEKLKVEASYFYNVSDNFTESITDRQYITDDDNLQRFYYSLSDSSTDNYNHRINAMVEYKPNSRQSFMIRPTFSFQNNGSNSYSLVDNSQTEDGTAFTALNNIESFVTNDKFAYTISNNIVYRTLIGAAGRNLMFTANGSYTNNDNQATSSIVTTYPDDAEDESSLTKQNIFNGTQNYNLTASATYSEPVMDKSGMVTLKYNVNYRYSDADYLVYLWEQEENLFNPDYDLTSSNIYNSGYVTQNIGPGFMYSKPNSLQLNANLSYQYSTLANIQEVPTLESPEQRYAFDNFIYSLTMRKTFNPTNNMRVSLRSSTENPSVSDLQEVVKDSNPSQVTAGNSSLTPSYSNTFQTTYTRSNITKGRTFMAMLKGSYTGNSIGESTVILLSADDEYELPNGEMLEQYGQYTSPVNLDYGKWSVGSSISYGTPILPMRCNINLDLGINYSETPSILNDIQNINRQTVYNVGAALGSNINERVDFTLSYKGGYNVASYKDNSMSALNEDNSYLTHRATAQFKFLLWNQITLFGTTTLSQYTGITDSFNEQYILCNLYIGSKIFKNKRGEFSVGVNDIFNQTESFSRNITESYVENVKSNSIGRYVGFVFTYDLRKFNGQMPQGYDRGNGGGRGGPGGSGGHGGGMGGGSSRGMGGSHF